MTRENAIVAFELVSKISKINNRLNSVDGWDIITILDYINETEPEYHSDLLIALRERIKFRLNELIKKCESEISEI